MGGKNATATVEYLINNVGVNPRYAPALSAFLTPPKPVTAPAPSSTVPSGPRPGDVDFAKSFLGGPPANDTTSAPTPIPSGPRPGDPGFVIPGANSPLQTPPSKQAAPAPAAKPQKPLSLQEQAALSNASIDQTLAERKPGGAVVLKDPNAGKVLKNQIDLSGVTTPKTAMQEAQDAIDADARQGAAPPGVGGGGPVHVGWIPASRQRQIEHGMSAEEVAPIRKAMDDQQAAGIEMASIQANIATQQGIADAAYANAHDYATREYNSKIEKLNEDRDNYVRTNLDFLNGLSAKAQAHVDPDAWFKEKGTGGTVFAAIAVALGEFGSKINGGPNTAWQIINSNIERNIRAQETNIANAGRAYEIQSNVYAQNLKAFGDRAQAIAATKVMYLDQIKTMLDAELAKNGDQKARVAYLGMMRELSAQREANAKVIATASHDKITEAQADHFGAFGGGGASTKDAATDAHGYSEALEKAGIPAAFSSLVDIDRSIDTLGSGDISGIGPVARYVPDGAAKHIYGDQAIAARQVVQSLKNNIGHSKFGGALSPTEADKLDRELEGAHDAASLRRVVQSYRQALAIRAKNIQAGYRPEGVQLYQQRGGPIKDIPLNKGTTPYQRPVDEK